VLMHCCVVQPKTRNFHFHMSSQLYRVGRVERAEIASKVRRACVLLARPRTEASRA